MYVHEQHRQPLTTVPTFNGTFVRVPSSQVPSYTACIIIAPRTVGLLVFASIGCLVAI